MFADISFPISSFQVFSYKIPSELSAKILIGSTVNAPLGKRNVNGIVDWNVKNKLIIACFCIKYKN